jgi:tRNA (cytidine32/uridine32-2'-O)-methyltransferase
MLENIKIVLVQTFHPGNIGAVARAMKNMGLSQLVLVNPVDFPSDEAISRAGNATDLLEQAQVVDSLEKALEDCTLIVATSARSRSMPLPMLSPEGAASELLAESHKASVALVFGRERMGLHNDDLKLCHKHVIIDANPEYPVLNISQAVQILCYEIFKATKNTVAESDEAPYPANREIEHFFSFIESTLKQTGFINKAHPHQAMNHLRAFMRRARPTKGELKLLTGMVVSLLKSRD